MTKKKETERVLADTSVIIDGRISEKFIREGVEILIPNVVVQELEHQANVGKTVGNEGLDELAKLQEHNRAKRIKLEFVGKRVEDKEIKYAFAGAIDAVIRELAREHNATLVTSDKTQASVAKVFDIPCIYFEPVVLEKEKTELIFERYFDPKTMSVHLKEGLEPYAKRGRPGHWQLECIGKEKLEKEFLNDIIDEIIGEAHRERGIIEIDRKGCTIVQLGQYRIAITKFPFSEATEITLVRPIIVLGLADYNLPDKLSRRLGDRAEGILVVGPPGAGKTTFAQALAEFYSKRGKVVKTMEHPRDLQVGTEITQYGPLDGSMKNTGDILLLVRPDYTIYDEIRKEGDFLIFEDLRLAGVGMVGVAHAAAPIDAIQRFVGKVELGVIPQVVDTLIFIKDGKISTVYTLNITVKVPSGMTEQDLARPIVEVRDFDTGDLEYEIYTYGEEVVVIPVRELEKKNRADFDRISEDLFEKIHQYAPGAKIEHKGKSVMVFAPRSEIPRIVGKGGRVVDSLEKQFGVKISVLPSSEDASDVRVAGAGKNVILELGKHNAGNYVKIYAGDDYLLTGIVNKEGDMVVKRKTKSGKKITRALDQGINLRYEIAI
ncbi:MAG: PIN domain-containing protein [Candidatus Altiarchaeota archaeon]|nr:PIN domain-containing protein [Candidatus Altiarchaeota archaeon]